MPHTSISHTHPPHPFTTPRKPPHTHVPSPLSYSFSLSSTPDTDTVTDTVTNPDRAKPLEIQRVLSPLRARRTPVLVKAPDVRWRLGLSPGVSPGGLLDRVGSVEGAESLRSVESVELFVSSAEVVSGRKAEREGKRRREGGKKRERGRKSEGEAAETSTRTNGVAPRDTPLPLSRAGSGASVSSGAGSTTTTVDAIPVSIPLPPSPPALQHTPVGRDNEGGARPTGIADGESKDEDKPQKRDDQTIPTHCPHPLSPVYEADPPPSLRSRATALDSSIDKARNGRTHVRARGDCTAGSRTPRRKPAHHTSPRIDSFSMRSQHEKRDQGISAHHNTQDEHAPYLRNSNSDSDNNNDTDNDNNIEDEKPTSPTNSHAAKSKSRRLCRKLAKFKKGVRKVGHRAVEGVARKVVARVLAKAL